MSTAIHTDPVEVGPELPPDQRYQPKSKYQPLLARLAEHPDTVFEVGISETRGQANGFVQYLTREAPKHGYTVVERATRARDDGRFAMFLRVERNEG